MKNFSYASSLFKGNHSMERELVEYETILLRKCKIESR